MDRDDYNYLRKLKIFDGFTEADFETCGKALQVCDYQDGDIIFSENEHSADMYLIQTGCVEVLKSSDEMQHVVSELQAGSYFGELSFLDDSPRSSSIRSKGESRLWKINKAILKTLQQQSCGVEKINKLYRNIALGNSERLRHATSNYAQTLEKENQLLRDKNYFNRFMLTLLATYSIMLVITTLLAQVFPEVDVYGQTFTWVYLILLLAPVMFFVIKSGEPWEAFGITTRNWKQSVIEGLIISFIIMLLAIIGFYLAEQAGILENGSIDLLAMFKTMLTNPVAYGYFVHSLGQELLARGVFQNSLQRAFDDEKGWKAVLITSFMFGVSHILYGAALVAVTVVSGFLFGFIFLRHKNLLGVGIVHGFLGTFLFSLSQLPFLAQVQ
ncbi:cyclic nucleotide-binding domain-containing protein [Candidatus Albibeggiatoa sp. nov. NOAA]|uniref:cyclic nucleotide-binding domain-containing protein n=1 Tax=Candidatus Albibeggiatoa sp. nov. NOAA TaxID=3162724 RepID=UPI0032F9E26D|nr:cyclic nucleotide-binding domain-containing protein [Thiotrichaceae bacterium]